MCREIEPIRRSFCRHGSCTFTEVARVVPSGAPAPKPATDRAHGDILQVDAVHSPHGGSTLEFCTLRTNNKLYAVILVITCALMPALAAQQVRSTVSFGE